MHVVIKVEVLGNTVFCSYWKPLQSASWLPGETQVPASQPLVSVMSCDIPGTDETQVFHCVLNNFPFPQLIIPVAVNNQKICWSFISKLWDMMKIMVLWNQDHTQLLHSIPMGIGSLGLDLVMLWKSRLCSHHLLSRRDCMLGISFSALIIVDLLWRMGTAPSLKGRSKAIGHALRLNKRGLGNSRNIISRLLTSSLWARCQRNRRNWLINTGKPLDQNFPLLDLPCAEIDTDVRH